MKKLIRNYTTEVPLEKTVAEIQKLLSENGATGIAFDYDDGKLKAIFFRIKYQQKELAFKLPAKVQNVYDTLFAGMYRERAYGKKRMQQAERIAWRVCKLWLEAQITHINLDQATMQEVFLPYLLVNEKKTLYENMEEKQFLLPGGNS